MRSQAGAARYDDFADWYAAEVERWGPAAIPELVPDELTGRRILDLGCGEGRLCRVLAAEGAAVTGVDISERLLDLARSRESSDPLGIEYVLGDAGQPDGWWNGVPFDGVICDMALMDIDDLESVAATVERVTAPDGWFVFAIFHPCFPGTEGQQSSWPSGIGYGAEGWWMTDGVGVRGRVGANHRMVSTYINAFATRRFRLMELAESARPLPFFLSARFDREP